MRSERVARALLRLYPRAWRARYGDEFFALIEESGATPRLLIDVAVAAVRERTRALLASQSTEDPLARVPGWILASMLVKPLVLAVCVWILADGLVRLGFGPVFGGFWTSFVAAAATLRILPATIRAARKRGEWIGLGGREIMAWTGLLFLTSLLDAWPGPHRPEFWVVAAKFYAVLPLLDTNSRQARTRMKALDAARRLRFQQQIVEQSTRLHLDR